MLGRNSIEPPPVARAGGCAWLGVPILAGERVLGVIALQSTSSHAFTDADERVLSTLASSMGVALENARPFDETKRLLAETDERAAELAVINEIALPSPSSSNSTRSSSW